MKRLVTRFLVAGIAWLGYAASAHADPTWTYTTLASPLAIAPDVPGGGLVLTSQSTPSAPTTGGSQIVATTVIGSVSQGTDHYTNAGYSVDINVKDFDSGLTHTFTFKGQFSGNFSATTGSQITHQLQDPVTMAFNDTALVSESFTFSGSGNTYTVTLDPHVIVGNLGSLPASIGGTLAVVGGPGDQQGDNVSSTPEPSTMVLSLLGLSVAGVTVIRRRLRGAAE
jgi:hypothetical protein